MSLFLGESDGRRVELPPDAVTQTFGILGIRGSGKTNTAVVFVEEMVRAELPVVVVDPVGVWWGLRSSADGGSGGLPVVIFGGDHADVPLTEDAGALIASFVVSTRHPVVLDLSKLRKAAQNRFLTSFAEELYHENRDPLHLVIDEADAAAPQRPQPGDTRLLGAIEDLVRRGRARGLGLTLITQRAAVLNKNVLSQVETLIALRCTSPHDRAAIEDWISAHGTEEQREALLGSLSSLPVGTAWLSSPGWLQRFERVAVRPRSTFDSSATPKIGEASRTTGKPHARAPVDLDAIRGSIARLAAETTPPGKKAPAPAAWAQGTPPGSDPARIVEPMTQIAHLQRLLGERDAQIRERDLTLAACKGENAHLRERLATTQRVHARIGELLGGLPDVLRDAMRAVTTAAEAAAGNIDVARREPNRPPSDAPPTCTEEPVDPIPPFGLFRPSEPKQRPVPASPRASKRGAESGERRVLIALAQHHPKALSRARLALLTGNSVKGGAYQKLLSDLRAAGHLVEGGDLRLTDAGLAAARPFEPLPTGAELAEMWIARLDRMPGRILSFLVDHPGEQTRAVVAAHLGYEAKGGAFQAAVSRLLTLGLVTTVGKRGLRASDDLLGSAT